MLNRSFTLIYADLEVVKEAILDCNKDDSTILDSCYAPLEIQLEEPIPYFTFTKKIILWQPPNAPGTVLFGNENDGFSSLGYILNLYYHLEMTRIGIVLDVDNGVENYGLFCKFEHIYTEDRKRYVRVMWDNRWDFYETGEPFPFEQTENYKQRIRRKRLTTDMVLDYAKAMGWDLRNQDFWSPENTAYYLTYKFIPQKK